MKLEFHGAAGEVTGSCHLLKVGHQHILLDCGLIQGSHADQARNAEDFPFEPGRIDAVVLSHAHIDHSGRLPLLVKRGFKGPIYAQRATRDLSRILLKDSAHLAQKDAELESLKAARRGDPPVEALYTVEDVGRCLKQFRVADYGRTFAVGKGVRCTFHDAGHILGSSIVELSLEQGGERRSVVFSGDLGNADNPLMPRAERVARADLVLMESTYGDRDHRSWEATERELGNILKDAHHGRGNIVIPAFAVGRTQELLHLFGTHYREWGLDRWHVFVDSPLAIAATEIYAKHWMLYDPEVARRVQDTMFRIPKLFFSQTPQQSMAINRVQSGAIIIAGSGMCTGGRIRHHLKHNLWRSGSQVLMVGYQARGTLGRQLVDGASMVRLWGEEIHVAAKVHTVNGLSAHAGQAELVDWYRGFQAAPPVALVHGEDGPRAALAARLGPQALSSQPGTVYDLAGRRWLAP
jgi:metallo-beta-lactamase family protein